jgi:hypothetical protein
MTTDFDAEMRFALDQFDAPLPRANLVDDIVSAADARRPSNWPSRTRSRLWARRGTILMMATVGLMSATAGAAGGWFGEKISLLPVISSIASVMPDAVKAKRKVHVKPLPKAPENPTIAAPLPQKRVPVPEPRAQTEPAPLPASAQAPDPLEIAPIQREARIERITSRIAQRLDRRDARRAALGLPLNSTPERTALDSIRNAKTDEERRSAVAALKALRQARRAALQQHKAERGLYPPCAPDQAEHPWRNKCRLVGADGRPALQRNCAPGSDGDWSPRRCRRARWQERRGAVDDSDASVPRP